jgi:hypothetical protein
MTQMTKTAPALIAALDETAARAFASTLADILLETEWHDYAHGLVLELRRLARAGDAAQFLELRDTAAYRVSSPTVRLPARSKDALRAVHVCAFAVAHALENSPSQARSLALEAQGWAEKASPAAKKRLRALLWVKNAA